MKLKLFALAAMLMFSIKGFSQDKNFYIFLAFGQSNMEGESKPEKQDSTVDSRFQVLQAVDCAPQGRLKDKWYTAVPPLSKCNTGLNPGDYFGRELLKYLPKNARVGIINVSVAGAKIEAFDNTKIEAYTATAPGYQKTAIANYGGSPYNRLVELGKEAQKVGVIKGFLLHQGESNTGDTLWTRKVKDLYDRLITDLKLDPKKTPLLAGETVNADHQGRSAAMNKIIATLPQTLPNSYVISSLGLPDKGDHLHFSAEGYRKLGARYGAKMASLLGYKVNPVE